MREENYSKIKRPPGDDKFTLVQRFAELLRKLWNPRNFKAHVSPHEMLQAVVLCSKKRFQITEQGDPIEFLGWFLNQLHIALNGNKKTSSSIVYRTFRGKMKAYTRKVIPIEKQESIAASGGEIPDEYKESCEEQPFLFLTLDLPQPPLFKDELQENIIPQVPLHTIFEKFDGVSEKEYKTYKESVLKRFEIIDLPDYLILYIKRFTKNTFFIEKNPTIVNFPIKDVDLTEFLTTAKREACKPGSNTYDLVANIVHDGEPGAGKGTFRVHLLHRGTQKWFELQDLHVTEILPQMITLSEAYIQVWERQKKDS